MIQKRVTIGLPHGLQARPAARLVQEASQYRAALTLETDGRVVNVKSIMGVMSAAPLCGEAVLLRADGPDEAAAINALGAFVERNEQ
ncbi:MAG: HPr family phosphocarrier protein [Sporolactobacillus sp.]